MQLIKIARLRASADEPLTEFEGHQYGAGISCIIVSTDKAGVGPYLHRHPYPETFVLRSGRVRFTIGDEQFIGIGGHIIVVPAYTPHAFEVIGSEPVEMTDIHASDTFITEWLEGPQANA